jgi:hypothetical protein
MSFSNLNKFVSLVIFTVCALHSQGQCENDTIAPTGIIIDISSVVLGSESYEAEIYAIDFFFPIVTGLSVTDNCTSADSIRYTFTDAPPESDPTFLEEYNSSSVILTCIDMNNSPIEMTVYAWDLAGNFLSGTVGTTVLLSSGNTCPECLNDTLPPEIIMLQNIGTSIDPVSNTVEIWAADFVASAVDFCSPNDSIQYTFSDTPPIGDPSSGIIFFDCYDFANSPITVEVYAWDTDGNYAVETSEITVVDVTGTACQDNFVEISGSVLLKQDSPFQGASINLENEKGDIIYTTFTDSEGGYTIFADPTAKYLSIEYDDDTEAEITILDMVFMQRNLLGLFPFDDYQILASDIDGDNRMKINDLKLMRLLVLGVLDKDEYLDPNWRFVVKKLDGSYGVDNHSNRILISENPSPHFIGYRMGDVR